MKKVLITILVLSILAIPAVAAAFSDTDGHWAEADIVAMTESGCLNGYPDGTFRPDAPVTRAEFAKIICGIYDLPTSKYGWMMFDDVNEGDWYAEYVPAYYSLVMQTIEDSMLMAEDYGYSDSLTENMGADYGKTFSAETPMTRIEALWGIMTCGNFNDDDGGEYESLADIIMADMMVASQASDFEEFNDNTMVAFTIGLSIKRGLITGDEQGRINPYGTLSRAELCALLSRVTSMYGGPADRAEESINYFLGRFENSVLNMIITEEFGSEDKKSADDETIVATVNGEPVSLAYYNYFFYSCADSVLSQFGIRLDSGIPAGLVQPIRQMALESISRIVTVRQKAQEAGTQKEYFDPVENKIEFVSDYFCNEYFGLTTDGYNNFLSYLDEYHTSEYAFDEYQSDIALYREYFAAMSRERSPLVTEEEVNEKYTKASHVLIMIDDDTSDEEALAKANEVIARLNAGENMGDLIMEYGEDPGMRSREYYLFTEGEMVDEFYQGARGLEPGSYSLSPVKTSYGYHIIYRFPLTEGEGGYVDAVLSIVDYALHDIVDEWGKAADVQVYDEVIERGLAN